MCGGGTGECIVEHRCVLVAHAIPHGCPRSREIYGAKFGLGNLLAKRNGERQIYGQVIFSRSTEVFFRRFGRLWGDRGFSSIDTL